MGKKLNLKEQILSIRDSGKTNMFDYLYVQQLAYENDFYDLVMFIEEHKDQYFNFIRFGNDIYLNENYGKATLTQEEIKKIKNSIKCDIDETCGEKLKM